MVINGVVCIHSDEDRHSMVTPLQLLGATSTLGLNSIYDYQATHNGHAMFPHLIIKGAAGRIRSATALKKRGSIGQGLDKLVEEGDHALGGLERDGREQAQDPRKHMQPKRHPQTQSNVNLLNRSKAPLINQDQMLEFLESFFGQGDDIGSNSIMPRLAKHNTEKISDSAELLRSDLGKEKKFS